MRVLALVPAFQAAPTIGALVRSLVATWPEPGEGPAVVVVDDGSTDNTASLAARAGAEVVRHRRNRGKGVALRTGMARALHRGATHVVALDADGQHPVPEAVRLARHRAPAEALVLGVRDLAAAGAPAINQRSNRISNFWLSQFTGRTLADTQCGLRRYPLAATLALEGQALGFGFEAEILLRAVRAGMPLAEVPVEVWYPPGEARTSHFRVGRDPVRIIGRVLATLAIARTRR